VPVSVQSGVPVEQLRRPAWHGLPVGAHGASVVHAPHMPLEQTWLGPHIVPSFWSPDSLHFDTPVAHEVVPTRHGLLVGHDWPATHVAHMPPLQTLSIPHAVPSVNAAPVSAQSTVGEQTCAPLWQGLAGTQERPAVQLTHVPPLQTLLAPHDTPFGVLPDSMHAGAPLLHAVVPVRHALVATVHVEPATQDTQAPAESHTLSCPQDPPAGTLIPVSLQVGMGPEQSSLPT